MASEIKTNSKPKTYKARGFVYGNLWGGGKGAYPAEVITSDNRQDINQEIKSGISSGWLDSGMGYESLIGAIMTIETISTAMIDGKEFKNSEYETVIYGDLKDNEVEYLEEILSNDY